MDVSILIDNRLTNHQDAQIGGSVQQVKQRFFLPIVAHRINEGAGFGI